MSDSQLGGSGRATPTVVMSHCGRFAAALEGPLQSAGPDNGDMEDKLLPMQQAPLSTSLM